MQQSAQPIDHVDTILERELLWNDSYNANQLIRAHGDKIRYVDGWGWLAYDGKRWKRDKNAVIALAKDTLEQLGTEALKIEDYRERNAKIRHISRSLNNRNLQDMVAVAQTDKRIRAEVADFDANPYLLNVQNGTLNLETGELRPHDPEDMITQIAACKYNPDAWDKTFADFVMWVVKGRQDLHDYLQEAMGYSLTGLTGEKCLFLCYGPTSDNGKSTLLEAMLYVLGDYGAMTRVETVLSKGDKGDGIPADLAALAGKRFVITSETDKGQRFKTAQMKRMTGSDTVQARFMNQNFFTFKPQMKLWLGTNSKPEVPEGGMAVWRRIKMLPFDNKMPKEQQDTKLNEKLEKAAEAILAWAVVGCQRYLERSRLPEEPECMQEAQAEYQQEQDPFTGFVEECCQEDPDAWTPTKGVLLKEYENWYLQTYGKAAYLTAQQFHQMAAQHGYRKLRKTAGNGIQGLRLKQPENLTSYTPLSAASTADYLTADF